MHASQKFDLFFVLCQNDDDEDNDLEIHEALHALMVRLYHSVISLVIFARMCVCIARWTGKATVMAKVMCVKKSFWIQYLSWAILGQGMLTMMVIYLRKRSWSIWNTW